MPIYQWSANPSRRAGRNASFFIEPTLAHFEDLSDCDYFGDERAQTLKAVGWLDNEKMFRTGRIEPELFAKLKTLLIDPWQPFVFGGCHECELCQFDAPFGHANLFVPNGSTIFVCPELIVHYIASHFYRPPDEFLSALANCPDTRTIQYKKLLLESGGRMLIPKS